MGAGDGTAGAGGGHVVVAALCQRDIALHGQSVQASCHLKRRYRLLQQQLLLLIRIPTLSLPFCLAGGIDPVQQVPQLEPPLALPKQTLLLILLIDCAVAGPVKKCELGLWGKAQNFSACEH
jgi:hypothetical protein